MINDLEKLWIGGNPGGKFTGKDKEVAKFNRVAKIKKIYPEIDSKLRKFCEVESLTERKACAFAVLMMIESGIRVGNEESAEGYVSKAPKTKDQVLKTYGLTTLLRSHISFNNFADSKTFQFPAVSTMVLDFIGKKSVRHRIEITDQFLIKIGLDFALRISEDSNDDSWLGGITDKKVNEFIRKSIGAGFSAKDFRTFRANVEAARLVKKVQKTKLTDAKKKTVIEEIKKIVSEVAEILGNTPGIARKAYINPQILRTHWNVRGFDVTIKRNKGKVKEIITPKEKK